MGGQALKNCTVRRYAAAEYFDLEASVLAQLRADFPARLIEPIQAYRNKPDFGDMDVLMQSDNLVTPIRDYVVRTFASKEVVRNGAVYSFEHRQFQIDLILTPLAEFRTSASYFSFNDLGNLCGRLAQSLGLKLGHDGLSYLWRDASNVYATRLLLTDWNDILPVLDLDPVRWAAGFDDLEDIFRFVSRSRFFSKRIYLLENRNHASRIRDVKRKTYNAFLTWLETQPDGSLPDCPARDSRDAWLPDLFGAIPGFDALYLDIAATHAHQVARKAAFKAIVSEQAVGLDAMAVGVLKRALAEVHGSKAAYSDWVDRASDEDMRDQVRSLLAARTA